MTSKPYCVNREFIAGVRGLIPEVPIGLAVREDQLRRWDPAVAFRSKVSTIILTLQVSVKVVRDLLGEPLNSVFVPDAAPRNSLLVVICCTWQWPHCTKSAWLPKSFLYRSNLGMEECLSFFGILLLRGLCSTCERDIIVNFNCIGQRSFWQQRRWTMAINVMTSFRHSYSTLNDRDRPTGWHNTKVYTAGGKATTRKTKYQSSITMSH